MKVIKLGFGVFLGLLSGCGSKPEKSEPSRVLNVEVAEVRMQDSVERNARYFGLVEARRLSELSFELSGTLDSILVDEGETVEAGQPLALLDSSRLESRIRAAEAAISEAEANAKLAQTTYERISRLVERDASSLQELEEALQAKESAEAAIERLRSEADALRVDLGKSTLYAPYEGGIAERYFDEGAGIGPAQPVLQIIETAHLEAHVGISPTTARRLRVGDTVAIRKPENDAEDQPAVIERIAPNRDNRTRTVNLILSLPDSLGFLPGDPIEVILPETEEASGFWIPRQALTENVRGMWAAFVIGENGEGETTVSRRPIEVTYFETERAFVQGPLAEGDRFVVSGLHRLVPGQRVAITTSSAND